MNLTDDKCTYFLCPDSKCKLFEDDTRHVPCERECPHQAKKAIVCSNCAKVIELPFDHLSWCRVDCTCGCMNMQRMSSNYRRHNIGDENLKEVLCRRWMYIHGEKGYASDVIDELQEDDVFDDFSDEEFDKFKNNFIYALYEVGLELEIYKDGTYKILNVKE